MLPKNIKLVSNLTRSSVLFRSLQPRYVVPIKLQMMKMNNALHVQQNNQPFGFQRFYTDDSGFHSDFKSTRKEYQPTPEEEQKIQSWIQQQIESSPVVIFMKGVPQAPQCGFSALACEILKREGVQNLKAINVLEDPDIRAGIKKFSQWNTIPQIFINKEFIGGSDILTEMYKSGELTQTLKNAGVPLSPPEEEE